MADSWQNRTDELHRDRLRQDRDDLNNEVAGRDTGRIKRFVSPEHIGTESAKSDSDTDFVMNMASQLLSAEQQRQIELLERQFKHYDEATKLALSEIDQDIEQARNDYRRIQNNATVLDDGTRVYRDEETGHFYNENDQHLSAEAEIKAQERYNNGDSSRQQFQSKSHQIARLEKEKSDIKRFEERQDELQNRLEENPEDAAEIKEELDDLPAPERVQKYYQAAETPPSQELRQDAKTSFSKEIDDKGLFAGVPDARMAFANAHDNVETVTPDQPAPKPEQPMTLG